MCEGRGRVYVDPRASCPWGLLFLLFILVFYTCCLGCSITRSSVSIAHFPRDESEATNFLTSGPKGWQSVTPDWSSSHRQRLFKEGKQDLSLHRKKVKRVEALTYNCHHLPCPFIYALHVFKVHHCFPSIPSPRSANIEQKSYFTPVSGSGLGCGILSCITQSEYNQGSSGTVTLKLEICGLEEQSYFSHYLYNQCTVM